LNTKDNISIFSNFNDKETMDIKKAIEAINIDVDKVADPAICSIIVHLLNIIEAQAQEIKELKEENQKLRDENNRLKGGPGKPDIRPHKKDSKDISSENERKKHHKDKKNKKSKNKMNNIKIDRTLKLEIPKDQLPEDTLFKGYTKSVIQDIIIKMDNIEFKKEMYYSPSLNKTFVASLPPGYHGAFGPNLKSHIMALHFIGKMTEPAIVTFLQTHGVFISAATVSRIITDNHESFHQEKKDIVQAGLSSTIYQQMDDTGARVNGENHFTHILCNPWYTAYFTRRNKNRLTILEILTQGELSFQFNETSYDLMEVLQLSTKTINQLKESNLKNIMNRKEVEVLLDDLFPNPKKPHRRSRGIILEASAIVSYQHLPHAVPLLLTDDAPQFKQITELLALCWIHDGRHYKKLDPVISSHIKKLEKYLDAYWRYYHKLLDYKESPTKKFAKALLKEFDILFSKKTGYNVLDDRIKKTKLKKDELLLVLKYPQIPLHNNASELGARVQARYRDISFQTKNLKGTECKDTFMTIFETAKKLSVNAYNYILDRISGKCKMPSLASLITLQSAAYDTG